MGERSLIMTISDRERDRLEGRMAAYERLLSITTDPLAREAISAQMARVAARIADFDAARENEDFRRHG